MPAGVFTHKTADGKELVKKVNMLDRTAAFYAGENALIDEEYGVIGNLEEVTGGPSHCAGRCPSSANPYWWTRRY